MDDPWRPPRELMPWRVIWPDLAISDVSFDGAPLLSDEPDVAAASDPAPTPDLTDNARPDLFEPHLPSLHWHSQNPNKLTQMTARAAKAFQVFGEMTIAQIQNVTKCPDSKRVYGVVNGLAWAGLILRDKSSRAFRYCGLTMKDPIELDELAELRVRLISKKDGRREEVGRLIEAQKSRVSKTAN
jgi:hypothetical protein